MRINYKSNSIWEEIVAYSRVVKIGNLIEVSGTTASDENGVLFENDIYNQSKYILLKIGKALNNAGASFDDVIRTRIYVTDINQWQEVAKAHKEIFYDIKPATSMVEVSSLIDDKLLVEIELTAMIEAN